MTGIIYMWAYTSLNKGVSGTMSQHIMCLLKVNFDFDVNPWWLVQPCQAQSTWDTSHRLGLQPWTAMEHFCVNDLRTYRHMVERKGVSQHQSWYNSAIPTLMEGRKVIIQMKQMTW